MTIIVSTARAAYVSGDTPPTGLFVTPRTSMALVLPADGGAHRVTGSTKNTGTPTAPVSRRVRLHAQNTGQLIRELWSDGTTGAYAFNDIKAGTYYVVSFDHTNTHPGVIADNLTAEPMPS